MLLLIQISETVKSPINDVSWFELSLAFGLILIAISISRWQKLGLAKDLIVGAFRTVVQLVLVGYVLVYIFAVDRWYITVAILGVMLIVAVLAATGRTEKPSRKLQWITGLAMLAGSGLTLVYVSTLVVKVEPWHNPRYLIPLFGMIVGGAMNGAALAIERLNSEMKNRSSEIEAYLALGASLQKASATPVSQSLRTSLIPTINGLMVVGIVTLPGMMTGQILAGVSPLTAIRYQIVVVFMQATTVAITTVIITLWHRKSFFTPALQLKPHVTENF